MITVDQASAQAGAYEDDPLAAMAMRRTLAGAGAALLAALSVLDLLAAMAIGGMPHLWNLGLAGLIGAAVIGSYAGYLGTARLALQQLAYTANADATRVRDVTALERQILARLDGIVARLDRHDHRADELADELEELRAQVRQTAERVNAILEDELRQRRRYG